MNCVIDNSILYYLRKNKRLDVIRRYIRMKYRISIDPVSFKTRAEMLGGQLRLG